jgi:hypothetical protein
VASKNGFDLKLEATQILIDAIIDIDHLHRQQSRRASAPAIDAIVDIDC